MRALCCDGCWAIQNLQEEEEEEEEEELG